MRILYLSQLVPYPADAGPKVRIYRVLQRLAEAGHQITLVSFHRDEDRPEAIDHLRQFCHAVHTVPMVRSRTRDVWELVRSTFTGQPFLITRDSDRTMHQLIRELLVSQAFDAVHADQLWMAQYGLAAKTVGTANAQPKTVLDQHNAVYLIPRRLAEGTSNPFKQAFLSLEAYRLARYEVKVCSQFDQVVWVTDEDRSAVVRAANGHAKLNQGFVIPICVDMEEKPLIQRVKDPRRVTFLGGMHWPPNAEGVTWFAREVWPRVVESYPDAIFTVIGKNPPPGINSHEVDRLNIDVTGYVSDLQSYLSETAAFVVPLRAGGGMRVKILDAWCWGLPVVSTPVGAEGLRYVNSKNLLLAESALDFARAVITLLDKPELAASLSAAGREAAEAFYDWRKVYPAWDAVYGTIS